MHRQSFKKNKPSIIFWIFIILAIPLTIGIISYTSGYKFDPKTHSIITTSVISITTLPKDVAIMLNGKTEQVTTPYINNSVLPGEYSIAINKEGYRPWKKSVSVLKGRSVLFPDVLLFLDTMPIPQSSSAKLTSPQWSELPTDLYPYYKEQGWEQPQTVLMLQGPNDLLVDQQKQISYILPSLSSFHPIRKIDGTITSAQWNEDESVLLYTVNSELWIYNRQAKTETQKFVLLTRQSTALFEAVWHPSGNYIFFTNQSELYAIELDSRDHRQTWKLATMSNIRNLHVYPSGNRLLFESDSKSYSLSLYTTR